MPRTKTNPPNLLETFKSLSITEQVEMFKEIQSIMEEIKNQKSKELELLKSIHTNGANK